VVTVDCAKARSKWMLADFYANVLVPPTEVEHTRAGLDNMIQHVRQAVQEVFPHRCCQAPDYLLEKLLQFELDHATPLDVMRNHLFDAADIVPKQRRAQEAAKLQEQSQRRQGPRASSGVKHISEAILLVVARLLSHQVQLDAEVQALD
jgi:hypothetical protein